MPGVQAGDLGSKAGYYSKENGYLILKNVRIPRENMLMKYAHVSKDGKYKVTGDMRILYSVMLATRTNLICNLHRFLA